MCSQPCEGSSHHPKHVADYLLTPEPAPHIVDHLLVERRKAARAKIIECTVVKRWRACAIGGVALWNEDDHSLSTSSQNYSISILQIQSPGIVVDGLPLGAFECLAGPFSILVMKVSVPAHADPIQLETLDGELARHVF
jgi:hypothetical protein